MILKLQEGNNVLYKNILFSFIYEKIKGYVRKQNLPKITEQRHSEWTYKKKKSENLRNCLESVNVLNNMKRHFIMNGVHVKSKKTTTSLQIY